MSTPIRVLILENRSSDAELMLHELRQAGFDPDWQRVETRGAFQEALDEAPDLILADYSLPQFDALRALRLLQERDLDVPFIVVTGSVGEEAAVACMKEGAADYLLKDRLTRLGPAAAVALEAKREREERAQAREALQESERRFRLLAENIRDVFWVSTPGIGKMIYVSPAYEEIWGRTRRSLYENPTSFLEAIHPEERDWVRANLSQHAQGRWDLEYRIIQPNGSIRWIRDRGFPVRGGQGELLRMCGVAIDVTERKQRENRLELLSSAVEQSSDGIAISDLEGNLLFANDAFAALHGYAPEEIIGANLSIFHTPEQMPSVQAANQQVQATGEFEGEIWHVTRDGTPFPTLMHSSLLRDKTDKPIGMIGTMRDITEQKRAEEALYRRTRELTLLDEVSQAFGSTLDLDEVLAIVLDEVRDLLGVTGCSVWLEDPRSGELVCQQATGPDSELVRGWRLAPGEGLAGWTASHGENLIIPDAQLDERHVNSLGQRIGLIFHSIVSVPLQVKGRVIGTLQAVDTETGRFGAGDLRLLEPLAASAAVAIENARLYEQAQQEISERKRMEEALQASLREKEALLQEIHHRVKNNLQVITSLLRLQSRHVENEHVQEALFESRDRIQAMALVHEHLYQSPSLTRINLADYLRRYIPYLTRVYHEQARRITVSMDVGEVFLDIDAAVPCGLILNELVSNALKHAFPGERAGEIHITLHRKGGQAILTVSDDGVGFPSDVDFRRAESLGLQLVNTLVKQLKGTITLDRREGTTVQIAFTVK